MRIQLDKSGGIATVTIARPEKLNALSLAMYADLGQAFCEARDDDDIRAVVLTGAGEKAFCVGADLTESIPALASDQFDISAWDPAHIKNLKLYKPVISAIRGLCIGGGFEIMLASDIRICADNSMFQLPEPQHGFVPAGGTLVRLVRQVGYAHAMQIMLTGQKFSSEDMFRMGVVNEVLPDEGVLPRAQEIAAQIALFSTTAVQTIKEAALTLSDLPLENAFAAEAKLGQRTFTSEDAKQGLAAFASRNKSQKSN